MATRKATKQATRPRRTSNPNDAIALLMADHAKVKKMFKEFDKAHKEGADSDSEKVAKAICQELRIHTAVEEEIFYPGVRETLDDDDMMNEAEVEHASAKSLIEQIEGADSSDPMYAAKVMVLGEYIDHHVNEEHKEMFPKARRAKMDLTMLGEQIVQRKAALKAEMGIADDVERSAADGGSSQRRRPISTSHAGTR